MRPPNTTWVVFLGIVLAVLVFGGFVPNSVVAAAKVLVVPTGYPTIQSAVDAARPGDRIKLRPGTYREQVSIGKDLAIAGSGSRSTTIRAPETLVAGEDGANSIVEIHSGASVAMSRLAVSGPGAGTCDDGALGSGIRVLSGGHLDLSFARISRIQDTPIAPCFHSGDAILIGDFPVGTGSATIRSSEITGYQDAGIVILNQGSTGTVLNNVLTGQDGLSTDGIEFVLGAVGRISRNVVSGNACRAPDPGCGPDFFTETQHAGIAAGGTETVITRNLLYDNQVGIYVTDSAEISRNVLLNNRYFGMALQDGSFTVTRDRIQGGGGGVAVIAAAADTTAVLNRLKVVGTSGPTVQKFECCGFTATTIGAS